MNTMLPMVSRRRVFPLRIGQCGQGTFAKIHEALQRIEQPKSVLHHFVVAGNCRGHLLIVRGHHAPSCHFHLLMLFFH